MSYSRWGNHPAAGLGRRADAGRGAAQMATVPSVPGMGPIPYRIIRHRFFVAVAVARVALALTVLGPRQWIAWGDVRMAMGLSLGAGVVLRQLGPRPGSCG